MKPTTAHFAAEYGVRIGKPKRPAIDDRLMMLPPPACLDQRHRLARAIEHAVQVDRDAAVPVLGRMSSTLRGRPGDAGVVDQHVQAAETLSHLGEQPLDVRELRHVGAVCVTPGRSFGRFASAFVVDVADVDSRPVLDERARDRPADAGGARGHEHSQAFGGIFHGAA